ncbi:RCC1 domain-containing protein [Actinoplanes teichomyceticus]|uniref:RCC1 domain-containing protein n=1 Tax=Actinoplanes teichomyceticus TaxID=1867 RepID=UPI0011A299A2|nr:chromosome condensation regulator RCC1 [Actinoplanes teichomyceticus]
MLRRTISEITTLVILAAVSPAAVTTEAAAAQRHGEPMRQVVAGDTFTCGLSGTETYCWGAKFHGQLGTGGSEEQKTSTPVRVRSPRGVVFTELVAGSFHTCGISAAAAFCWGLNTYGELGEGGTTDQATPARVQAPPGVVFTQLAAGDFHTCGISAAGTYCWGQNTYAALGDGGVADRTTPVRVRTPPGVVFTRLAAGGSHTCGISDAGTYCWGSGTDGQLGDGGTADRRTPVRVRAPRGVAFTQLTAGILVTCGISGAATYCWGANHLGQLGIGGTADRRTPVRVRVPRGVAFTRITAGASYVCGISGARTFCWGDNSHGQLGDGGTAGRATPGLVQAPPGVAFTRLAAGWEHTCGISGARTFCWGWNVNGQLGDGGTTDRTRPVEVVFRRAAGIPATGR